MLRGLRKKASLLAISAQQASASTNDSTTYRQILKQVHDFEVALKAMDYLLDDRTPEGVALLEAKIKQHHQSASEQPVGIFHLALGVIEFIEATLGFESDIMQKAHKTLSEAETSSMESSKYNVRHSLVTSHIYPPGTEYQVTHAEATLLNALVMLLQENNGMVESAKALYKLRKAYHSLDAVYKKIKEAEPAFNRNIQKLRKEQSKLTASVSSVDLPGLTVSDLASLESSTSSLPEDLKLMRDLENVFQMRKSRIEGTNIGNGDPNKVNLFANPSVASSSATLSKKGSVLISEKNVTRSPTPSSSMSRNDSFLKEKKEEFFDAPESSLICHGPEPLPEVKTTKPESDESDNLSLDEFSDAFENVDSFEELAEPSFNISDVGSIHTEYSERLSGSSTYLHVSTIDEYIHSGVQLCFGILQVVLSLIPPAIGKVLSIVGFKGERDIGLKLLWRNAITCRNIHGDLALLCLMVFYDGPVQFVDSGFKVPGDAAADEVLDITNLTTISDEELEKVVEDPQLYTPQLLKKVRGFFPHNALWLLQEGRILAFQGEIEKAIDLMQKFTDDPTTKIQMKQSEALLVFDRAMLYTFNHQFDEAARDFIKLVDLNSWSRSVYIFMAGACYLAKYRMFKLGLIEDDENQAQLQQYAAKADKYLKLSQTYVPGHGINASGRKGGIGGGNKQLPFDKFVLRKIRHLEEMQKQYPDVPFVDLVGTSLVHELIYFWNGYNRMNEEKLNLSLKILGYSGAPNTELSANSSDLNHAQVPETTDEAMIRYFFQSICLRSKGKVSEGLNILDTKVISKFVTADSPFKFSKMTYSPYLYPTALYEKTMFVWLLRTSKKDFDVKSAASDSKAWLKKAELVGMGDYELSNRTGMRIKAAGEKLDHISSSH